MVEAAKDKPLKSASDRLFGFHTIYGVDGEYSVPYMTRVWFGRLRLHVFHRGDNDPDCHDHPWDFWTLPLTSYVEEVAEPAWVDVGMRGFVLRRQVVRAFRLHYRPATHCHRVIGRATADAARLSQYKDSRLPDGVIWEMWEGIYPITDERRIITLVWRGRQGRKWGFLRNRDGQWCWTPWKDYVFGGGKNAPCGPEGGDA